MLTDEDLELEIKQLDKRSEEVSNYLELRTTYYSEKLKKDFDYDDSEEEIQKEIENNLSAKNTRFAQLENYINERYDIRYNLIRSNPEIKPKNSNKSKFAEVDDRIFKQLKRQIKLSSKNLENVPSEDIKTILTHSKIKNYNPIKEYFEKVFAIFGYNPLHDADWIYELSKCVKIQNNSGVNLRFDVYLRQFLLQCVYCSLDNYPNENLLLIQSAEQGLGKTRFIRHLFPTDILQYIKEGKPDIHNKDGEIDLSRFFIIFVDEFDRLNTKDSGSIKAYLSKSYINVRLPFGELNSYLPRRANFLGACNTSDFLYDDEERRIWCFNASRIIFEKESNIMGINNINIDKVWAQVYYYYLNKKERAKHYISKDLEKQIKQSNQFFMYSTIEEELIDRHCKQEVGLDGSILSQGVNMADVTKHIMEKNEKLSKNINPSRLRKYLRKKFGEYKSVRDVNNKPIKGWNLTLC